VADTTGPSLGQATTSCVAAARQLGDEVDILVCGSHADDAVKFAATIPGVSKVVAASHPALQHLLAEPMAKLIQSLMHRCALVLGNRHAISSSVLFGEIIFPCMLLWPQVSQRTYVNQRY
jgi:electron transfer flavoprotein alpha subunit